MYYPLAHLYWEMINNGYPLYPTFNSEERKALSGTDHSMQNRSEKIWIDRCNRICLRIERMPTPREAFESTLRINNKQLSVIQEIDFNNYQKKMTANFLREYWKDHDYEVTEEEVLRRMEPYYREHPYERPEGG